VALRQKWLPNSQQDNDFGTALYLEKQYWQANETSIFNAISKALNG
jgi:hypothetical protein